MNEKKYPSVIISGLGISGLITASLFCKEKIKVECFEPNEMSKFGSDQRTTAFLSPAISVFKEIGVWKKIEALSQPLKEMEIIDVSSSKKGEATSVVFEPKEINVENFGYNVPNNILRSELLGWLKKNKNFVLNMGDSIVDHYAFDDNILVKTAKGKEWKNTNVYSVLKRYAERQARLERQSYTSEIKFSKMKLEWLKD